MVLNDSFLDKHIQLEAVLGEDHAQLGSVKHLAILNTFVSPVPAWHQSKSDVIPAKQFHEQRT